HEDKIAMFANLRQHRTDAHRVFGRGGAWSTSEVEHRIRRVFRAGRGQDENVQTDLAAFAGGAVLKHFEGTALRFAFDVRRLTRRQLERRLDHESPSTADDLRSDNKGDDEEDCKTKLFTHGISLAGTKVGAGIPVITRNSL